MRCAAYGDAMDVECDAGGVAAAVSRLRHNKGRQPGKSFLINSDWG